MNCKEGEMAIVVKSRAGNEGKVLTCVRYVGQGYLNMFSEFVEGDQGPYVEHVWEVDVPLNTVITDTGIPATPVPLAVDSQLRPLRGNLTEDEEEIVKELYTA